MTDFALDHAADRTSVPERLPSVATALEAVFAVALVFALTQGPVYTLRRWWLVPFHDIVDDQFVITLYGALYAVALALLAHHRRWQAIGRAVRWSFAALFGLLVLSTTWSSSATRTFTQTMLATGTVVAGFYLGACWRRLAQVAIVFGATQLGTAISAVQIWRSRPGSLDDVGNWTGIYINRNSLGPVAALAVLTAVLLALALLRQPWSVPQVAAVVALGAFLLLDVRVLVGAGSITPVAALAAAGAVAAGFWWLGVLGDANGWPTGRTVAAGYGMVAVFAASLAILQEPLREAVGKSKTLEGRTPVWELVVERFRERPWHGWGYLSSWLDLGFGAQLNEAVGAGRVNAHNTYLEVLLGAGVVGGLALAAVLAVVGFETGRSAVVDEAPLSVWPVALFAWFVASGVLETLILGNVLTLALLATAGAAATATGLRGGERVI